VKFALKLRAKPKAIAKKLRITERTVKNIKRRKAAQRRKGSGRKEILSQGDKMRIIYRLKKNPFMSLEIIKDELNLFCTVRTIGNYLRKSGFRWRKPEHKPPLTSRDKNKRLQWCEDHRTFRFSTRPSFQMKLVFGSSIMINLGGSNKDTRTP